MTEQTNQVQVVSIGQAKRLLSADALAHALIARAEAAGQSLTDWLADEEHAAEVRAQQAEVSFSDDSKK